MDSKLNGHYSNELQFKISLKAGWTTLKQESESPLEYNGHLKVYHRHSDTRDWHSKRKDLFAVVLGFGARYAF